MSTPKRSGLSNLESGFLERAQQALEVGAEKARLNQQDRVLEQIQQALEGISESNSTDDSTDQRKED